MCLMLSNNFVDPTKPNLFDEFKKKIFYKEKSSSSNLNIYFEVNKTILINQVKFLSMRRHVLFFIDFRGYERDSVY